MSTVDISKLNKAEVLMALFNKAKVQGNGFLYQNSRPMTKQIAQNYLEHNKDPYVDYLDGRVMKIDFSYNKIDTFLYNRDNGSGAAEEALKPLFANLAKIENKPIKT